MKHRGFTLVELLTVIVVIGVLSAMMMLSSTEAVSSAKAADIISDMRNLKTATLEWYADNISTLKIDDYWLQLPLVNGGAKSHIQNLVHSDPSLIKKYLNNENLKLNTGGSGEDWAEAGGYSINDGNSDRSCWFVVYRIANDDKSEASLRSKLQSRAESVGLLKSPSLTSEKYDGGKNVYMMILSLK